MTETPYTRLLTSSRFRPTSVPGRSIVAEAESDRGRLLFCAAFRRLQQKAQVFSMEPNAAVRSRLTHSFEVSQMGRYISDLIVSELLQRGLATESECTSFVTFVETACLMHDIGNPPFGHFGEAAIRDWFAKNAAKEVVRSCKLTVQDRGKPESDPIVAEAISDFVNFDGNPQGLRVVGKLQWNSDEHGLNLTKTAIASYLKYIRSSREDSAVSASPFFKKVGYFGTEVNLVNNVWRHFDYQSPQRFPLAYVMEAADDIAYCISDLEDSIEKGLLSQKAAFQEILDEWRNMSLANTEELTARITEILENAASERDSGGRCFTYTDFRTSLNRLLVEHAANAYLTKHEAVLSGELSALIPDDSPPGKILELLKGYCREKVYRHESVQKVELAGYSAIYGLLELFSCLLGSSRDRFERALNYENKDESGTPIVIEKKILALFPKNYVKVYRHEVDNLQGQKGAGVSEWVLRAHLIVDFLSGMTDDFAMTTYRTLSGMRL